MSYLSDLLGSAYKEGMTEDEISIALETISAGTDTEIDKLKSALSKANSEAASYKKQLRSKQSDDEALAAAQKEEHEKLIQENQELKRSITLTDRKAKLVSMGYDEALALETAAAMVDGDMDKVMANQAKYLEVQKKNILADKMRDTPRPVAGDSTTSINYTKKIEEARANSDYVTAAYYTRLQATEEADQTINNNGG